jgi:hypothetical protein
MHAVSSGRDRVWDGGCLVRIDGVRGSIVHILRNTISWGGDVSTSNITKVLLSMIGSCVLCFISHPRPEIVHPEIKIIKKKKKLSKQTKNLGSSVSSQAY